MPLDEFFDLCGWTPAAKAKAEHYRSEFNAGRAPVSVFTGKVTYKWVILG